MLGIITLEQQYKINTLCLRLQPPTTSDNKLLVDGSSTTGLGPYVSLAQGGWSMYPLGVRVRIERRGWGILLKVWRSAWSTTSNALVPSTLLGIRFEI